MIHNSQLTIHSFVCQNTSTITNNLTILLPVRPANWSFGNACCMGTRALFSVPGQFIWFANGGGGEVAFVLLSVSVMVGVIYVKDCVVFVNIFVCIV